MRAISLPVPKVSRGFEWESDEKRADEFRIASHYLARALPGTVLQTQHAFPDPSFPGKKVTLSRRYLKGNQGECYAIASGNKAGEADVLGQGGFGLVRLAQSRDGKIWAAKEYANSPNTLTEEKIAFDLRLAKEVIRRSTRSTLMYEYLGVPLDVYLCENEAILSEEQRLVIAVKMFVALYRFHSGQASSSGKKYAHRDVKPNNFTIDENGDVHLIDFGLSEENPNGLVRNHKGTACYLVPDPYLATSRYTKESVDVFAWLRSVRMPEIYQSVHGCVQKQWHAAQILVIKKEIRNNNIIPLFPGSMAIKKPYSDIFSDIYIANYGPHYDSIPTLEDMRCRLLGIVDTVLGSTSETYVLLEALSMRVVSTHSLEVPDEEISEKSRFLSLLWREDFFYVRNVGVICAGYEKFRPCYETLKSVGLSDEWSMRQVIADIHGVHNAISILAEYGLVTRENIKKAMKYPRDFVACVEKLGGVYLDSAVGVEPVLTENILKKILDNAHLVLRCLRFLKMDEVRHQHYLQRIIEFPEYYQSFFVKVARGKDVIEEFEIYSACARALHEVGLENHHTQKALLSASQKKVYTVSLFLEKGIAAAQAVTKDVYKKKACDLFSVEGDDDLKGKLLFYVRIFSHPTNMFRSRSSANGNTAAFIAAKPYFEKARDLLCVSVLEWDAIIKNKPSDEKGLLGSNKTYAFFKKHVKEYGSEVATSQQLTA